MVPFAERPFYVRAALFGLLLYLVAVAMFFVAILIFEPSELPFVLFFLVPAVVVALALLFIKRWGFVFAIVGGAFGLLIFSEDIDVSLTVPYSFLDFAGTIIAVAGLLTLLVASVLGLIESFRGEPRAAARPWELATMRVIVGALVIVAAFSAVATGINSSRGVSAADREGAIVVTAKKVKWEPEALSGSAGQPVKILVENKDPFLHTFTIHSLDIEVKLGPRSKKLVVVEAPAGQHAYVCRVFGHESDMAGVLTLQ